MKYAWYPHAVSPYDSLWALVHKFAFLNRVNHFQLRTLFASDWVRASDKRRLQELSFGDVSRERLATALELPPEQLNLAVASPYAVADARIAAELRYCPTCMLRGFHTAAFQIEHITRCPLHDDRLEGRCPRCAGAIHYRLGQREIGVPFGCVCGHVLWPGLRGGAWSRSIELSEERPFKSLIAWSSRFHHWGAIRNPWRKHDTAWMSRLACMEPIAGWRPECLGVTTKSVLEWSYPKPKPLGAPSHHKAPINLEESCADGERLKDMHEYFREKFLAVYRRRISNIIGAVDRLVGNHSGCAGEAGRHTEIKEGRVCVWGAAYRRWQRSLVVDAWRLPPGVPETEYWRINTTATLCYLHALAAVDGREADPYSGGDPLVHWIALQMAQAYVLRDFLFTLLKVAQEFREEGRLIDERLDDALYDVTRPVLAYYPGIGEKRPRIKAYVGASFDDLSKLAREGVNCGLSIKNPRQKLHPLLRSPGEQRQDQSAAASPSRASPPPSSTKRKGRSGGGGRRPKIRRRRSGARRSRP